ncbi:hypothetical protein [uncultured Pleomorphomonas sp.]|uniref:hypothetical protein n=1 Tax=uncultured Pleomorphomonas sp. TaxID=442121 RepID=UPI00258D8B4B|nr:hypothetical protein [uncultured Pleomorphomonas sp.]
MAEELIPDGDQDAGQEAVRPANEDDRRDIFRIGTDLWRQRKIVRKRAQAPNAAIGRAYRWSKYGPPGAIRAGRQRRTRGYRLADPDACRHGTRYPHTMFSGRKEGLSINVPVAVGGLVVRPEISSLPTGARRWKIFWPSSVVSDGCPNDAAAGKDAMTASLSHSGAIHHEPRT